MSYYPDLTQTVHLSRAHQHQLFVESGIDPEVAAERGYQTVKKRAELEQFPEWQRRLGLLVPMYSPDGETQLVQLRPNKRRKNGPKYETPQGANLIIDAHPSMRERVRYGDEPLWVTEGAKTGDANTSRGLPTVVLAGVWGWVVPKIRPYQLLPCWDHVRLEGRQVYVAFDSDVMDKPEVQQALQALVAALEARGAEVLVVYLPTAADGSKQGLDDFYAAGGTPNEARMLARKFEPQDLGRIRLSRDEKLRTAVEELRSRWWNFEWSRMVGTGDRPHWMRGNSCRDAIKVAIDTAASSGQMLEDGVKFTLSARMWALKAATSKPTILRSIAHAEAEGWLRKVYEDRAEDAAASYVLLTKRSNLDQVGSKVSTEGVNRTTEQVYDPGGKDLSAPRLRWSAPTFDRDGDAVVRDYIHRLGKRRGAIIDVLDKEGVMDISGIAEALHVSRARNLRRSLPMLEEAGIISIEGDMVSLTPDWLEALERERELKGEITSEELQRERFRRESEAFRNRHQTKPNPAPSEEEMQERRESAPRRRRAAIEQALARLFSERPEFRGRRAGQITCMLPWYLPADFPRGGPDGAPKDVEVAEILDGMAA